MCVNMAGRLYRNGASAFAVSSIVSYIEIVNRKSYIVYRIVIILAGKYWKMDAAGKDGKKWKYWKK